MDGEKNDQTVRLIESIYQHQHMYLIDWLLNFLQILWTQLNTIYQDTTKEENSMKASQFIADSQYHLMWKDWE
jgi:hypothetical protein